MDGICVGNIMVDCDDEQKLSEFYSKLLGWGKSKMFGHPALSNKDGLVLLFIEEDYIPHCDKKFQFQKESDYMSIIDTFDNDSPEILKPNCITSPVENFPKTVIITFKSKVIDILKTQFEIEEISYMNAGIVIPIYKFRYKESDLGIYMTVLGGAATVGLMEEVIVKGAEKILIFGSCGVLDNQLTAGHFIIPTSAYRDEGTSYHYMPKSDYVEIVTAQRLGEIFDDIKIPYVFGKTWTTDGFYRETKNNMEARKKDGCITVEMECASVMAASQFRSIPVYQFLYAEDSLDGETWDARTMGKVPHSDIEKYIKVALEVASRL
ncbi:nucleoside phosphorylase [Clostridium oryzae]|uniref:Uridine phosphorylase n=1 Tax=Clostridium oryzae TaxID=1450648 RepID=A0A1V4IUU1_9CLOT|nr:nucleoside phosphorylase [Clostridium oryzae]OPJ63802.1 purine nucleoside phosphorylase DeoD-type [Clostridium oryzae]